MITVFHKGDAPEILAALKSRGLAFTTYDLRACSPDAAWVAGMHLREIGRADDLGGGSYALLTPTTTIVNGLGRHVIAGDYPDTVLSALPPLDRVAVHDRLAPIHERRPDGRCSCKTSHTAQVLAEVNVTEPRDQGTPLKVDRQWETDAGLMVQGSLSDPAPAPVEVVKAPVCPECRAGKHRVCAEIALDEATDEIVPCTCPPAFGHPPRGEQ